MDAIRQHTDSPRTVLCWLGAVYLMILAMVMVGGITRLTGSGLSMVEWHPLMGAFPPRDEQAWQAVFAKYQQTPQFLQVNHWMTLDAFKQIFFWEYVHRLLGRLIGLVFALPWLWLMAKRRLRKGLAIRTGIAFLLGGMQGLLGWYMVRSGLVDVPSVSHFRLAAHLMLAFAVACWVLWIALDLLQARTAETPAALSKRWQTLAWALIGIISLQIVYGAFMAGTRAGYVYTTFPTMNGSWAPKEAFAYEPAWRNWLENLAGIHFIHRTLGWLTLAAVLAFVGGAWRHVQSAAQRRALSWLVAAIVAQFTLGALTVIWQLQIAVAVAHQAGGLLLLSLAVYAAHSFRAGGASGSLSPTRR